jgi:TRAP-type mannitol/chloroaromatic compound transport system permease small subunit
VWPLRVIFCLAFLLLALQIVAEVVKLVRALRKGA